MLFRWRSVIQVRGPALSLAPPVLIISEWLVRGTHRSWGQCVALDRPSPLGGGGQFVDLLNYYSEPTFEKVESCGLGVGHFGQERAQGTFGAAKNGGAKKLENDIR